MSDAFEGYIYSFTLKLGFVFTLLTSIDCFLPVKYYEHDWYKATALTYIFIKKLNCKNYLCQIPLKVTWITYLKFLFHSLTWTISNTNSLVHAMRTLSNDYTGWPRKTGTGYIPQYVVAITGFSVWGNFSWEKWYQNQQFWFSNLFYRAHFVRRCGRHKVFPFQLKLGLN